MRRLLDQGLTITSSSSSPPNSSAPRQHVPGPPSEKSTAAASNNVNNYYNSTSWASTNLTYQRVEQLKTTLHTSTALIILLLLSALCFLGFCSIYIRRLSVDNASREISSGRVRRRRPRASQGLEPAEIGNLPHYVYRSGGNEKGIQTLDCAVCLSEFEEMEIVKALPLCRHAFHQQCIDVWLASNSSCPLCRSSVLLPSLCCLSRVEEVARTTLSIATAESDTSQNRGEEEMGGSNSPAAAREEENEGVSFVVGDDRSWDSSSGCSLPVLCS